MMEDTEICDMELDAIVVTGAQRYLNSRRKGTSALLPPDRDVEADNLLMERQAEELSNGQLAIYHLELLRRAENLLFFIDANMGGTDDFPLQLFADNPATMRAFKEELKKVRNAVGCLTEV